MKRFSSFECWSSGKVELNGSSLHGIVSRVERRGARGQVSSPWDGEEGCGAGEGGWGGLG